jgi:hypothetical protein
MKPTVRIFLVTCWHKFSNGGYNEARSLTFDKCNALNITIVTRHNLLTFLPPQPPLHTYDEKHKKNSPRDVIGRRYFYYYFYVSFQDLVPWLYRCCPSSRFKFPLNHVLTLLLVLPMILFKFKHFQFFSLGLLPSCLCSNSTPHHVQDPQPLPKTRPPKSDRLVQVQVSHRLLGHRYFLLHNLNTDDLTSCSCLSATTTRARSIDDDELAHRSMLRSC